jgi:dihydroorotate dehydrogenase electron transfer subunit
MLVKKLPIVSNTFIKGRFYKLILLSDEDYNPGQFIHIRVNDSIDPLLRRPFSIYSVKHDYIELLYEVIGKGTLSLSKRRADELLDVVGPLGNSFSDDIGDKKPLLVGGGIGVAPLFFLAERLISKGYSPRVILGYRSYDDIIAVDDFINIGIDPVIVTDDGSYGHRGLVTGILGEYIDSDTMIFSCGPMPMLGSVSSIVYDSGIRCELSLHNFMGCGFGVCLGCVIMSPHGYKRVCKDGPIFSFDQISIGI